MRSLTHNLTFDRLANTVPVVGSQRLLLFHERLKERERKREKERERERKREREWVVRG